MRHAGWEAVLPRIGFEESFGQGEEVQEYRRFVIEVAKVWLASPNFHFRLPQYRELVRHLDLRYLTFSSLDELEVVIMARASLLSLTIEEIEARLLAGFAKVL